MWKVCLTLLFISLSIGAVEGAWSCTYNGISLKHYHYAYIENCTKMIRCFKGAVSISKTDYKCFADAYCDNQRHTCACNTGFTSRYVRGYLVNCYAPTTVAPTQPGSFLNVSTTVTPTLQSTVPPGSCSINGVTFLNTRFAIVDNCTRVARCANGKPFYGKPGFYNCPAHSNCDPTNLRCVCEPGYLPVITNHFMYSCKASTTVAPTTPTTTQNDSCSIDGKTIENYGFAIIDNCTTLATCVKGSFKFGMKGGYTCPTNSFCDPEFPKCKCKPGYKGLISAKYMYGCKAFTTVAPTANLTTAAPTQPPTSVAPTQSLTTAAPTQPSTTAAPTQPPTTAAPTQPHTTAAPTQLPTTAAPTQPPTTAAATQPPTTALPTQPPTTAAPTQPLTSARTISSTPGAPSCPSTWTLLQTNVCVKAFPQERKTWADARGFCKDNYGGDLVQILNSETSTVVASLLTKPYRYWIGVHDPEKSGDWQYINGQPLTSYKPWAYKEPNNYGGNEFCVEMKSNRRGTWNDKRCSRRRPFVCQK